MSGLMTGVGPSLLVESDPNVLVPGSSATLEADAGNLERMARVLTDEADTLRSSRADGWEGAAAEGWAERRQRLADGLDAVAGAHQTAASALRGHAGTLGWAQQRAAVAVGLWTQGVRLRAAAGLPPLTVWDAPNPFAQDPGEGHRDLAEAVLASARSQVAASASAATAVLAALDDGLPDGRWHASDFARGAWGWATSLADLVVRFHPVRVAVDNRGWRDDVAQTTSGVINTFNGLATDPLGTGRDLADLDTLQDRPGAWWGGLAPDVAMTALGVGAAAVSARSVRVAAYLRALELGQELPGGGLYPPASVWNDPVARLRWYEDLLAGPDSGPDKARRTVGGGERPWLDYQRRTAGPEEYRLTGDKYRIWADSVQLDLDGVAVAEAKHVQAPGRSVYEGTASSAMVDRVMAKFDDEMRRYALAVHDGTNPIARVRIYTSTPEAVAFLTARARAVLGPDVDLQVVLAQ